MAGEDKRRDELAASAALLSAEVNKLGARLQESSVRVAQLTARNELLDERAKRHSYWIWATALGLVLSLVSIVVLGFVVQSNWRTSQRLEATIARLDKSVRGQCDFNALLLGSYRPESRPAGPDRDAYIAGFARMREIYDDVGCTAAPLPPATPR